MQALILAGGKGTRLRAVLAEKSTCMAPVAGEPLLAHIIRRLVAQEVRDIVLATGYLAVPIRTHLGDGKALGCRIHYSQEAYALGTAGALRQAEPMLEERFLVLAGNALVDLDVASFAAQHRGDALLGLIAPPAGEQPDIVLGADGLITAVGPREAGVNATWAGVALLERRALRLVPVSPSDLEQSVFPGLVRRKVLRGVMLGGQVHRVRTPAEYRALRAAGGGMSVGEQRAGAD